MLSTVLKMSQSPFSLHNPTSFFPYNVSEWTQRVPNVLMLVHTALNSHLHSGLLMMFWMVDNAHCPHASDCYVSFFFIQVQIHQLETWSSFTELEESHFQIIIYIFLSSLPHREPPSNGQPISGPSLTILAPAVDIGCHSNDTNVQWLSVSKIFSNPGFTNFKYTVSKS